MSDKTPDESTSDPNAGAGDPTDGRKHYQWKTRYQKEAWVQIISEAVILLIFFITAAGTIVAAWSGWVIHFFNIAPESQLTLKKYLYYSSAGMLGGSAFGIKYFYRVIARGYWHQDRIIWRIKSPLLAAAVAFVVGALIDASMVPTNGPARASSFISIGFLAGYFADQAVAKMYEVASVLFGTSAVKKHADAH